MPVSVAGAIWVGVTVWARVAGSTPSRPSELSPQPQTVPSSRRAKPAVMAV